MHEEKWHLHSASSKFKAALYITWRPPSIRYRSINRTGECEMSKGLPLLVVMYSIPLPMDRSVWGTLYGLLKSFDIPQRGSRDETEDTLRAFRTS